MKKTPKFDGSEQEMVSLGYMDIDGNVFPDKRNEMNLYLKEVKKRNKYKNAVELIEAGIVDKDGRVLDKKRLAEIESKNLDKKIAAANAAVTRGILR